MDKILLSTGDIEFALKWRDEHKDLVRSKVCPIKAVKIVCLDSGYTITAVRNGSNLRLGINEKGMSIGSLTFEILDDGRFQLAKDRTKLGREDKQSVLTVYCSVMALLVFGKETIDMPPLNAQTKDVGSYKPKKKSKKHKRSGVTYILNRTNSELKRAIRGSHSSPKGIFSVRGHYRHYKSGKVVWIAEFTKGSGNKKDKTYKVGMKGDKYEN